jgi:hypothetical protein
MPRRTPERSNDIAVYMVLNDYRTGLAYVETARPSCFALDGEKGEDWKGTGAMKRTINEVRPSL